MTVDDPAAAVRRTMTDQYREFEKLLADDQEVVATVFVGGREFRLRVAQVGSAATGMINVFGYDLTGSPIDLWFHFTQLCYVLEAAASADKPRRIGFSQ